MANGPAVTCWQEETLFYDKIHPRMVAMAKCLTALPHRSVLDIGCSAGTMQRLLPADFSYYGCDITDHAGKHLPPGHFHQIDLNATRDLSFFANKGIRVVNIGGVLEYLKQPGELFAELRRLVGPGGHVVCSMVNFQAARYADSATHHPAWAFKPPLEELRQVVTGQGWQIARELPFIGPMGWRTQPYQWLARYRGVNHPWTRKQSWLVILIAEAA